MRHPLDIIIAHVHATLPDSLCKRKELLAAVLNVVKPNHPARRGTAAMLTALHEHDRAQTELALEFPKDEATR